MVAILTAMCLGGCSAGVACKPCEGLRKHLLYFSNSQFDRQSGMVRQHQTRNLEIPGSTLRIASE
jgi:hypothetical protein